MEGRCHYTHPVIVCSDGRSALALPSPKLRRAPRHRPQWESPNKQRTHTPRPPNSGNFAARCSLPLSPFPRAHWQLSVRAIAASLRFTLGARSDPAHRHPSVPVCPDAPPAPHRTACAPPETEQARVRVGRPAEHGARSSAVLHSTYRESLKLNSWQRAQGRAALRADPERPAFLTRLAILSLGRVQTTWEHANTRTDQVVTARYSTPTCPQALPAPPH